jgi:type I restriction enzyme S subunit
MNLESWRVAPLGEVCEISTKLALDPEPPSEMEVSFVPMAAIDETEGAIVAAETRPYSEVRRGFTSFRENDVLFAKITPCMENGKAAIARDLRNGLGFGSTEFYVLRAGPDVRPEWLFAFIRRPAFRAEAKSNFTGSAGQQRVPVEFLRRVQIPVPPLAEQDRLVEVLSSANELSRLRRHAHQSAEHIASALFKKTFEPASSAWPDRRMGDLVCELDTGKSLSAKSQPARPGKWGVLKVSAVTLGVFQPIENKELPDEEVPNPAHEVRRGDLVISRANTTELVGACAIVRDTPSKLLLPDKLWRVVLPESAETNVEFLNALLKTQQMRREIGNRATGTSGSMKNISQENFLDIRFKLPPKKLQDGFARAVRLLWEITDASTLSGLKLNELFQSLLSRAFTGELTATWRANRASQAPAPLIEATLEEVSLVVPAEPQAPPISVPQIIADRDRIYTSLSPSQRALFDRVTAEPDYFTAEEIAKEDAFDLVGVKRGLQLLAAAGFIIAASRAVNPSESQIFYVDSFRMPRAEDDVRLDLVSEYLVSE